MNRIAAKKIVSPITILFIIVNAFCLVAGAWLDKNNINHIIILYANVLFFLLGLMTAFMHISALKKNNPYAFVRSVMLSSFLKLIVIAAAVLIYLLNADANKNIYAIVVAMVLYILYTIIEVKAAMQLNKNRHAEN